MVYDFGIYEKGKYSAKVNGVHTKEYLVWYSMISRCYNKKYHGSSNYENVIVCDEWRYFQNFAEWFKDNYYYIEGDTIILEKDFKSFAYGLDKIYSPNNCIFLPQVFNKTITFQHSVTYDLPIGVKLQNNKYKVFLDGNHGFNSEYKSFDNKEVAYEWYLSKIYDRLQIRINNYKDLIPIENVKVLEDFITNDSLREMHKMQKLKAE